MIDPVSEAFTQSQEGGRKPPGPGDPNPTQFGVTQTAYNDWLSRHGLGTKPVYEIPEQTRHAIYGDYWDSCQGDNLYALSPELALLHYDCAFNSGPHEAALILQATVNVPKDGVIGAVTLAAVQQCTVEQPRALLMAYLQNRWDFLQELHNFPQWGRVWAKRLNACADTVGVDWQAV